MAGEWERVLDACDLLEQRLEAVDAKMTPGLAVRRVSGNVPVQGGYQSPLDPRDQSQSQGW